MDENTEPMGCGACLLVLVLVMVTPLTLAVAWLTWWASAP